jgi:hypothetical protein
MHPIERLRWVARGGDADPLAVVEAAEALAAFADDPAGLVTACRRLLERCPGFGPLWWMASRVLCALDPDLEAYQAAGELERDPTPARLAGELPAEADRVVVLGSGATARGLLRWLDSAGAEVEVAAAGRRPARLKGASLALLEAQAAAPAGVAVAPGTGALARAAREAGVPLWLVAGVGRVLPPRLHEALVARAGDAVEVLPASLFDRVAGPEGLVDTDAALRRADCPVAPELLHFPG